MGREKKDKKKTNQMDEFYKYTSRDIGQEFIMKRKMIIAIVVMIFALAALAVFIALYIDETRKVQETYYIQFHKCLDTTITDVESYINGEADYEFKYRRIVADMSSVASFSFLLDSGNEEQKKTVNELYTVFLKYPEQMSKRMEEALEILKDINANLDKGYEEADSLIGTIDLKGY